MGRSSLLSTRCRLSQVLASGCAPLLALALVAGSTAGGMACSKTVTNSPGNQSGKSGGAEGDDDDDDEDKNTGGAHASGGRTGDGGATGAGGRGSGGQAGLGGSGAGGSSTVTGGAHASGGATPAGGSTGTGGGHGGNLGNGGDDDDHDHDHTGGSTGSLFSDCRFHFCAGDWTTNPAIRSEIDYFTSGWLLGVSFNHGDVCAESAPGGALAGKLPVMVSYIAADYVKRTHGLCDCNVTTCGNSGGRANDLCNYGAQYITQDWAAILNLYKSNSDGFANCMGGRPIVFAMEPDWYQYYAGGQTQPWTVAQAGTNMTALVNAMKSNSGLKAYFSLDVSPWIPNNGSDWYSSFDLGLFAFINTSGGGTDANNARIRGNNAMTWAGVIGVTGKPLLADTGYGANGSPAGEDANWNVAANINARIAEGVIGICQYNPTANWGATVAGIRNQLNKPRHCP